MSPGALSSRAATLMLGGWDSGARECAGGSGFSVAAPPPVPEAAPSPSRSAYATRGQQALDVGRASRFLSRGATRQPSLRGVSLR